MLKPRTIVLVDDNSTNLDLLFDMLDQLGHRVLVAENGESAVRRCKLANPDVIFMNRMLPGIDGLECCRRIKADKNLNHTPVIMMSESDTDNKTRRQCYESGACAYITMPILKEEASVTLKNQLELINIREELQTAGRSESRSLGEFDVVVDLIAHDMKSPIGSISGFAEELTEQFNEEQVSDEWVEYMGYIHKSAHDIDIILEALVLLKNLRIREWREPENVTLDTIFKGVTNRYSQLEYCRPLALEANLADSSVLTQPALLEELILILFRNCSNLVPAEDPLRLSIETECTTPRSLLIRLNANTREIATEEFAHILEPLQGRKRKRVQDTNILLLCVQKMIAYLGINAWVEHGPNNSLTICLTLEPGK
jgi:CheY-like chemotaxis protein